MAKLKSFLFAWMFPCIIFCVWLVIAHFEWIPSQILPAPSLVASTFTDLWASGELQGHIGISLQRVMSGFGVGALTGLLLGTAMGLSPTLKDYVYPIFKLYSQVPMLGWLPLLIMLVGIDEALKIILISKGAFVPVTLNTYKGLQGVPSIYIEVARVYRFTKWQLLKKVVFPSALPPIWMGLRHGLTHAWLALVAVELLASSEGLGFLMVYGRQLYQLDVVLVAVVIVGGIGLIFDKLLSVAETYLLRWRHDAF
ncbi:MAG: ABC transporter permease [Pseudomonadota bacterium]